MGLDASGREVARFVIARNAQPTRIDLRGAGMTRLVIGAPQNESGGIGLYCHSATGDEFLECRVGLLQWSPYYRFEREETLAAGTRLRIFCGNTAPAGIAGPLEIQRFATEPFDQPDIQFVDPSIDLRVVGRKANEHARRFLPDSDYAAVATRVLHKADGTAFLIFPNGPNSFAPGNYRLGVEYRRDISASDRQAPLLSEQASRTPKRRRSTFHGRRTERSGLVSPAPQPPD